MDASVGALGDADTPGPPRSPSDAGVAADGSSPEGGGAPFAGFTMDTAVILVKFADFPVEPYAADRATGVVFEYEHSLAKYVAAASHDLVHMVGQTYGWYTLDRTMTESCATVIHGLGYECDVDYTHIIRELAGAELDHTKFDRFIVLVHGMGTVGEARLGSSLLHGSASSLEVHVLLHELGHTFGALHAGGWECDGTLVGPSLTDLEADGCRVWKYDDSYSPMGGGVGHFDVYHMRQMGWMASTRVQTVSSSGTHTLHALEKASEDTQGLYVTLPDDSMYVLEYRKPVGIDALSGRVDYVAGANMITPPPDGVQIRLRPSPQVMERLDIDADTLFIDTIINPGSPFDDPHRRVRIAVTDKMGDQAQVEVTYY